MTTKILMLLFKKILPNPYISYGTKHKGNPPVKAIMRKKKTPPQSWASHYPLNYIAKL